MANGDTNEAAAQPAHPVLAGLRAGRGDGPSPAPVVAPGPPHRRDPHVEVPRSRPGGQDREGRPDRKGDPGDRETRGPPEPAQRAGRSPPSVARRPPRGALIHPHPHPPPGPGPPPPP